MFASSSEVLKVFFKIWTLVLKISTEYLKVDKIYDDQSRAKFNSENIKYSRLCLFANKFILQEISIIHYLQENDYHYSGYIEFLSIIFSKIPPVPNDIYQDSEDL